MYESYWQKTLKIVKSNKCGKSQKLQDMFKKVNVETFFFGSSDIWDCQLHVRGGRVDEFVS